LSFLHMSTKFFKKETPFSKNSGIYFGVNSLRRALAEVIKARMARAGELNPNQLAIRTDVSAPAIRKVLSGEHGMMVETLVTIAGALDTTAPELLLEALYPGSLAPVRTKIEHHQIIENFDSLPRAYQQVVLDLLTVLRLNQGDGAGQIEVVTNQDKSSRKGRG
jgi:transcriptional regulator with XRE-family HTH domain